MQKVLSLCAVIAWCEGVLISGYSGHHEPHYADYAALEKYGDYDAHAAYPTVAVPVHSVSAAPLHLEASHHGFEHHVHPAVHPVVHHQPVHHIEHIDHGHHDHGQHDHDYYVSSKVLLFFFAHLACGISSSSFISTPLMHNIENATGARNSAALFSCVCVSSAEKTLLLLKLKVFFFLLY